MQLVGQACVHCQQRIPSEIDGRFCPRCYSAVHHECTRQVSRSPVDGRCFVCGAPRAVLEAQAKVAEQRRVEAEGTERFANVVLVFAGLFLFVGGLVAAAVSFALTGGTAVFIAGGAMFGGLGMAAGGLRRALRR